MTPIHDAYLSIVWHPLSWIFVGLTLTFFLIQSLTANSGTPPRTADDRLQGLAKSVGLGGLPPVLFLFVGLTWLVVALTLLFGLYRFIWMMVWQTAPTGNEELWAWRFGLAQIAALTTVLGAVIALPLTMARLVLTRRQADIAQEGLITERINTAVAGLGAEKTVSIHRKDSRNNYLFHEKELAEDSKRGNLDFKRPVIVQLTEPNLEVRIGAIYALERIAHDSNRDIADIVDLLCAYIRHNAPKHGSMKSPHEVYRDLNTATIDGPGLNAHQIFEHRDFEAANTIGVNPTELNHETLAEWSLTLPRTRIDIQTALSALGRLKGRLDIKHPSHRLDLSDTNLQNAQLVGRFNNSDFSNSHLDNCKLNGQFDFSNFTRSSLQQVHARNSSFSNCDFGKANLCGAFFGGANLERSRFWFTWIEHTNFNGANLVGSDFYEAETWHVYLHQDADASYSRFSNGPLEAFKGLEDGPTRQLWCNEKTRGLKAREKFAVNPHQPALSELEDRELWLSYLNEAAL
ncbi:pentapeptide repeat-containing protein [Roseovarius indicus]|uniref:pentapeptide repeat-containing protein n=1 Tax=Roseovarius indicus TaxID=540747 RepID=UPI0032EC207D